MVNKFKVTLVHFARPTPDADLCMRVDLPLDKKLWKIRTGPPGHRPVFSKTPYCATWDALFAIINCSVKQLLK